MVDWNGLFKWSMGYQDGTSTPAYKEMTEEDKKWLEEAMNQFTFKETDRLNMISQDLKNHMNLNKDQLIDDFEELTELVELSNRNAYNLCLTGGMQALMDITNNNPNAEIRRQACSVMALSLQFNKDVQNFASRLGCLNLLHKYHEETNMKNKESIMGVISAYIRSINYEAKREFLKDFDGLGFLSHSICDREHTSIRLLKKELFLLYDLVSNDDHTFKEDPFYVRKYLIQDKDLLVRLIELLLDSDLESHQKLDIREYTLRIFKYLVNYSPGLLTHLKAPLDTLKVRLVEVARAADKDRRDLFTKELNLILEVFNAPHVKILSNVDTGEAKTTKPQGRKKSSSGKAF